MIIKKILIVIYLFSTMNLYKLQMFNGKRLFLVLAFLFIGVLNNKCFLCKILTNSYLVEFVQDTDHQLADQIAKRNGFINLGPVSFILFF